MYKENQLLGALPDDELDRLKPHLELVPMTLQDTLYESGGRELCYVYFPTSAVVSLHYLLENGQSCEIASVGNEGMLGVSLLMGGHTTPNRAFVLFSGYAYRIKNAILFDEFQRSGTLQKILLRYLQAFITQISQTAVCFRHHSVEQQLCRWLLLMIDRIPLQELTMTQELIASTLGVRREGITRAARYLQDYGCIDYRRGHITVLDRDGLAGKSCECYEVVKREFTRLLQDTK